MFYQINIYFHYFNCFIKVYPIEDISFQQKREDSYNFGFWFKLETPLSEQNNTFFTFFCNDGTTNTLLLLNDKFRYKTNTSKEFCEIKCHFEIGTWNHISVFHDKSFLFGKTEVLFFINGTNINSIKTAQLSLPNFSSVFIHFNYL